MSALRKIREIYWLYIVVLALCVGSFIGGVIAMWLTAVPICRAAIS